MLRGKLKLPDRLGDLIARFDDGGGQIGGSDSTCEHGEELETFRPNGFGRDREIGGGDCEESGSEVPSRSDEEEEATAPVKVSEVVSAIEKRSEVECELLENEMNLERLRQIADLGLPDGGVRATTWKLLLGYLPPSRDLWEKELTVNRLKYAKLKEEILCSPVRCCYLNYVNLVADDLKQSISMKTKKDGNSFEQSGESGVNGDGQFKRHEISHEDHPLSSCKASYWQLRSEYTEVAEQIDRDLQRTHPDMKFFSGESSFSKKNREAMRSILLLFAKLNPAIRYVQGMNEVLAPIYYVFSNDTNDKNAANAEADSFSCFVLLLSDSVDHFCQQLDNSSVGILSTLSRLSKLLKAKDEELWWHLQYTMKVEPQFYAFRWITLLLTQEFSFQLILRIWDSILSNPFSVQDVLLRICCAMLLCMKSRLISGDFVANMKLLQHYPEINIEHLLQVAMELSPYMAMASQGLSSL